MHPEAFGIVAVEAMASGLALISSGVGGASEVFEDNISGLKFEAGNMESLAEQIKRLFNEPKLLKTLQENGLKRSRNEFDVKRSSLQIEQLLKNEKHKKLDSSLQKF